MYTIRKAKESDFEILSELGVVTYSESHGEYIENKNDLLKYNTMAFSVEKLKTDLTNETILFHIILVNNLPVGYSKLVLDAKHESITSKKTCRLERIYILKEFIPLKIGQPLLNLAIEKAKALNYKSMWLSVYIKNERAIRFYEKNEFKTVGELNFNVNGTGYKNFVLKKTI
jgi:ribosomal protein S18 acetylase RimI-like enzyme